MISQSRYVKIVSSVGAGAVAAQRKLIMRIMTTNSVLPPGVVLEASTSDAVGTYFGTSSEEYKRALAYFSFISKSVTSPSLISFSRWVNAAIAPTVVGDSLAKTLANFTAFTAATLTLSDGSATPIVIQNINFSAATSLTQVASILQTALQGSTSAQLASCTVTYNTNTNQFVLTGSNPGSGSLSVKPTGATGDVSADLGWTTSGTVLVAGQAADTMAEAISKSAAISNNFGSFIFAGQTASMAAADIANVAAVAEWNDAQNEMYLYSVPVSLSVLGTLFAAIKGYSGVGMTVLSTTQTNDYAEQCPCELLAATNYSTTTGKVSKNFMYYQFSTRNITVTDDTTADTVDASRGNYIGQTQQAGQSLAFYQRGVLCGGTDAATDMNTYCNEIWLKATIVSNIFTLFLDEEEVPANTEGASMIQACLQSVWDQALSNGVFSVGKTLTQAQQQYITSLTGDATAWRQVQNAGYWISISFASQTNANSGLEEWYANYTLVYSKSDAIRLVTGGDVMI